MTVRYVAWQPDSVLARCVGYGSGAGALTGFMVLLTLYCLGYAESAAVGLVALEWGALGLVIAVGSGAVIGMTCGLIAFIALLAAGKCDRNRGVSAADRRVVRVRPARTCLCAGGGAALLPGALAVVAWVWPDQWLAIPLFFIATIAGAGGLTLGPRVMYGPAGKRPNCDLDCAGD